MTPAEFSALVLRTVVSAVDDGRLPVPAAELPTRVVVESPPAHAAGDYGTAAALRLAPALGVAPGLLAELLREELATVPGLDDVQVAGPGFLDVTLDAVGRADLVRTLAAQPTPPPSERDAAGPDIANWSAATGDDPTRLAIRTEEASPLFRVQYATSRALALLRAGRTLDVSAQADAAHPYTAPAERALLAVLADAARHAPHPDPRATGLRRSAPPAETAESGLHTSSTNDAAAPVHPWIADTRNRHTLPAEPARQELTGPGVTPVRLDSSHRRWARPAARHLQAVADAFHRWTATCPTLPKGDEKPEAAHRAGLALAEAASAVLLRGLTQLGVTAPVRI